MIFKLLISTSIESDVTSVVIQSGCCAVGYDSWKMVYYCSRLAAHEYLRDEGETFGSGQRVAGA